MKINVFLIIVLMTCCFCSCNQKNSADYDGVHINVDNITHEKVEFCDLYSEIEFIPLENRQSCMLTRVTKLIPLANGYCVLNKSSVPSIYLFDNKGKFVRQIGRLGKSKGEFQNNVLSLTATEGGDTIVVSTFNELLMYNKEGRFLFSKSNENGAIFDIEKIKNGYACSFDYHGADYTLSIINNKFENLKFLNPTSGLIIPDWGMTHNPVRYDDNILCFFNQYNSSFLMVNLSDSCKTSAIYISSEYSLSFKSFENESPYDNDFVTIYDYYIHNMHIIGNIIIKDQTCLFDIDIDKSRMDLYDVCGWKFVHEAFDGEYIYTVLTQDEFLSLCNGKNEHMFDGLSKCNYSEVRSSFTELDNFVIAKIKRRLK